MKIQVLGSGCTKCKTLHKTVEEVVKNLGIDSKVEYSTDMIEITKLGAMSSPVFAIDGKIISVGEVPTNKEIENALKGWSSTNTNQSCFSGGKEKDESGKKNSCCIGKSLTSKKSECCFMNDLRKIFPRFF